MINSLKILILSIISTLILTGCGTLTPSGSIHDPDGDGDSKGSSSFASKANYGGQKTFVFDPKLHAWAAYDSSGDLINTGRASGGGHFCPDVGRSCKTVVGNFRVLWKKGEDCVSGIYPLETNGGSPMPHCMFFHPKGYAVHGSHQRIIDRNESHGCIRVTPGAAKWLHQNFMSIGTKVIVRPYS